jgi:molybdopterin molybdotransferase
LFHKVTQKPGKPLLVAVTGRQLLFGLPGNPLACHLGFDRYIAAVIRQREGRPALPEPSAGTLAAPLRWKGGRTFFLLARAQRNGPGASEWSIVPLPGISSADLFTPGRANCYLRLPPGKGELAAGATVPFTWIAGMP